MAGKAAEYLGLRYKMHLECQPLFWVFIFVSPVEKATGVLMWIGGTHRFI